MLRSEASFACRTAFIFIRGVAMLSSSCSYWLRIMGKGGAQTIGQFDRRGWFVAASG